MRNSTLSRTVTAGFVGALFTLSPLAVTSANAAPPADCPSYPNQVTTSVTVTATPASPSVGQTFTATATVVADNAPVSSGTVTFGYAGDSATHALSGGVASTTFTAHQGRFPVSASYGGSCQSGGVALGTGGGRFPVVAGVSGIGGGDTPSGSEVAGVSGTRASGVAGLAGTGLNAQTELYGVLGLGLVAVGGLTLLVHRRRVQA
ncbi:hypothetical protein KRR39_22690 [Nocardioides panacis]|uniref:Ig-like domain repeat protein n=1 Tax=Nocardioides panacis TaxID=2849501 RepID=A0A975SYA6_9ACTN|nr:hypothetical protein [Nocardioides panacis]QWZ08111.1 hypothetical protein KRR39_22690 [Nocardioides panacis]